MRAKKACAYSGNYRRTKQGSARTRSIVADSETFRIAAATLAFATILLAVPTIMALLKSWGVW